MQHFNLRATSLTIVLLGLSTLCQSVGAQSRLTLAELKQKIEQELSKQTGVFAVAFKDVATGNELLIREREVFHAASTMKTPVMIEVYKQQAQGKLSLSDSILIKTEFKSIVDGVPIPCRFRRIVTQLPTNRLGPNERWPL
ncbi:serine hydrolase [Spirosoma telluris]|uniref:serine hydrolase n=1 Tax=Spirosoma telluris TaxID=2183553 RepID=UPI002FC27F46